MQPIYIDDLVDRTLTLLARANLAQPGRYRRRALPPRHDADAAVNEYGVADAANLLYTLGHFRSDDRTRSGFIQTLQGFQHASNGLWAEATHHTYHCTAHCIAALELFDARPLHPLTGLQPFRTPAGMTDLLENLLWKVNPWGESHKGAGVFSALLINGDADQVLRDTYFNWLELNWDPVTGFLRRGCQECGVPAHNQMGGTFHYLFNIEADRRRLPYAKQMVDSCLQMAASGDVQTFARQTSFLLIDWVYCLNRAVRHSGHRFDEAQQAMTTAAKTVIEYVRTLDASDPAYNDLHMLFGNWCALAELQSALPGLIRTNRPLKLVLDRRPFI